MLRLLAQRRQLFHPLRQVRGVEEGLFQAVDVDVEQEAQGKGFAHLLLVIAGVNDPGLERGRQDVAEDLRALPGPIPEPPQVAKLRVPDIRHFADHVTIRRSPVDEVNGARQPIADASLPGQGNGMAVMWAEAVVFGEGLVNEDGVEAQS